MKVPIIVGTNIIRLFKETEAAGEIPEAWQTTFDSLYDDEGIPVRTTNKYAIRIGPNETITIHGIARRVDNMQTAVTEHTDTSLSGGIVICPRLVSVKPNKQVSRVPVRVCNLSARVVYIPPRSKLCKLQSVLVVDSWTPDPSRVPESEGSKSTDILDTLGVKIDSSTITHEKCDQGKEILTKWSHIFSTDLGDTDTALSTNLTQRPNIQSTEGPSLPEFVSSTRYNRVRTEKFTISVDERDSCVQIQGVMCGAKYRTKQQWY